MGERIVIVNADDFGFTKHVTDAIAECHSNGIVTSTTLMVNMPAAEYAVGLAERLPELGIGVHVNLTEGRPTAAEAQVRGLLGEDGLFPGNAAQSARLWRGSEHAAAVRAEIDAQVRRCIALGVQPTHCDSHHGIHKLPVVRRALVSVLREHGIRWARTPLSRHRLVPGAPLSALPGYFKVNLRRAPSIAFHMWSHLQLRRAGIRTPDWKATRDMGVPNEGTPRSELLALIAAAPVGVSEILLHPGGYGSDESPSQWRRRTWAEDTPVCVDPEVIAAIAASGVRLASFRDL